MTSLAAAVCLAIAGVWMLASWVTGTYGQGGGSDLVSAALAGFVLTAAGFGLLLWRQPSRLALAAMAPLGVLHLGQMAVAAVVSGAFAVLGGCGLGPDAPYPCLAPAPPMLLWLAHGVLVVVAGAIVVGRDLKLRLG